jgi:amino acid transporter
MINSTLRRELGVVLLTAIGIGAMVGSGIYTTPGLIASVSGPLSVLAIVLISVITAILMYILAELGKIYPRAGGIYYFSKEVLGDLSGFITGLSYYFCCFIGTAAIIYSFLLYLSYYIPGIAVGLTLTPLGIAIAIAILAIVTIINVIGIKYGAGLNLILTLVRMAPLLAFIVIGFSKINTNNFQPLAPYGFGSIGLAIAFGFWMFVGFESLVLVSEEVKQPEKVIMKSAIATVVIVSAIYILLISAFIGAVNWEGLGIAEKDWKSLGTLSSPLADVSRALGVMGLAEVMVLGAVIASAGCFSDWVLLQGRVAYALSRENRLWKPLAYVHPRFGTPSNALIFSSILTAIIMILIPSFPNVILISMITEFIPYGISALSFAVLRRVPRLMLLGYIGFVISTLYIYWACWPWTLTGVIIAMASLILYSALVKSATYLSELKKNAWYIAYLIGLTLISLLGDRTFEYNNFLPVSPLNVFPMPYDAITVIVFSTAIFAWAYKTQKQFFKLDAVQLHPM